jgi:hypothetical protein
LELFVVQQAYSSSDHAQDASRQHDPGFRVCVSLGGYCPLGLASADQVCDEVVHFPHVAA